MADLGTVARSDGEPAPTRAQRSARRVRPRRGLPGGRAVVGGFLVAAAAVGIFAAYLTATAPPQTAYAVASEDVAVGSVLTGEELTFAPIDLPPAVAERAVSEATAAELAGMVTVAPLRAGDLLLSSSVVAPGGAAQTEKVSIAVPRSRALTGQLRAGERVDVVAAYDGYTAYVVRGVEIVAVEETAGGVGEATPVFTLALDTPHDVQAVVHAIVNAEVFLTRPAAGGDAAELPPPFRPGAGDGGDD